MDETIFSRRLPQITADFQEQAAQFAGMLTAQVQKMAGLHIPSGLQSVEICVNLRLYRLVPDFVYTLSEDFDEIKSGKSIHRLAQILVGLGYRPPGVLGENLVTMCD